ncbi:MAG: MBL fold metallo-hydrolase [Candidatus Nanohaloarchaeota archaeon]|nr:MBL fold metallo-hydrolase [Candidatus Nanohaloarchaeota archaeon]
MKLYVLGSGGGRYMLATQQLHTSGLWLEHRDKHFFIDPGTGALRDALSLNLPFQKLSYLFVSHQHLDHYGDSEAVIEAAYFYAKKRNVVGMFNKCMHGEGEGCFDAISPYHKSLLLKYQVFKKGDVYSDDCCNFVFTPTLHHEPQAIGMVIEFDDFRIGYTSDTEYFPEFKYYFKNVDVLIAHFAILKKESSEFRHADKDDAMRMVKETNASYIVFRHFSYPLWSYGLKKLKEEFKEVAEDKTIIFANDGQMYEFNK